MLHFIILLTLFIQHFSTCLTLSLLHHLLSPFTPNFKCMSASLCHHSLIKVAACYRNVERKIVHFLLMQTKVLSNIFITFSNISSWYSHLNSNSARLTRTGYFCSQVVFVLTVVMSLWNAIFLTFIVDHEQ